MDSSDATSGEYVLAVYLVIFEAGLRPGAERTAILEHNAGWRRSMPRANRLSAPDQTRQGIVRVLFSVLLSVPGFGRSFFPWLLCRRMEESARLYGWGRPGRGRTDLCRRVGSSRGADKAPIQHWANSARLLIVSRKPRADPPCIIRNVRQNCGDSNPTLLMLFTT
jgi:hypothetical protein